MGKDRIVIVSCVVLMVALLSGAAALMPRINHMRADLQLTAHDDVIENLPPEIAFTQAALGSFRGLAVDVLWGRVQRMQAEGKLYEAMQLADWITKLQPRFAQVWVFHAWNMSYNISVTTHTPQERWMWVQAGVKLLRDEAIPLNPNNVQLYRELGYIYLHKIGQYSDDMHWHYKQQMAYEWEMLLGRPPEGEDVEDVLAWFEPVAMMYEAYVNDRELGYAVRDELDRLAGVEEVAEVVEPMRSMTITQVQTRLERVMGDAEAAEHLETLKQLVDDQIREGRRDPVDRVRDGDSEVARQLDRLREHGFRPNQRFLELVAQLDALRESEDLRIYGAQQQELSDENQWLADWLTDESIAEPRRRLLAFARARVLHEAFRLDPIWMYELMRGEWLTTPDHDEPLPLPLDWRHPGAHALYWSSLGIRRNEGLLRPDDHMSLNTDRQVIHSLQALRRTGDVMFDLASRSYRVLPDPRYIDAHMVATYGAQDRISGRFVESDAPRSLRAGHENFLSAAVHDAYFYGEEAQARRYYRTLRELYADFQPDRAERYQQPLEDFVLGLMLHDELLTMENAISIVTGLIQQAVEAGFGNGRNDMANRFLGQAERAHRKYTEQQMDIGASQLSGQADRMLLPNFDQMVVDAFRRHLLEPGSGSPLRKARVWKNAPTALKRRLYDEVRGPLFNQARQAGLNPTAMYPPPEGMDEYRESRGEDEPEQQEQQPAVQPGLQNLLQNQPESR